MHYIEIALGTAASTALIYFFWNTRAFVEERERARVEDLQRKAALHATRMRRTGMAQVGHRPHARHGALRHQVGVPLRFRYGIAPLRLPEHLLAPRRDEI